MIDTLISSLFFTLFIVLEPWPISSSGHVTLIKRIAGLTSSSFSIAEDLLDHLAHGPIALVLLLFFFKTWIHNWYFPLSWKERWHFGALVIIADTITFLIYLLLTKTGKSFFPLWLGFLITACALLSLLFSPPEYQSRRLTLTSACFLGIIQGIALLPGISRFGATFVAARWLGFEAMRAFELSFLLAFPISVGGSIVGAVKTYLASYWPQLLHPILLASMVIGSAGAYGGFYIISQLVNHGLLWAIGLYEIIPIVIALLV